LLLIRRGFRCLALGFAQRSLLLLFSLFFVAACGGWLQAKSQYDAWHTPEVSPLVVVVVKPKPGLGDQANQFSIKNSEQCPFRKSYPGVMVVQPGHDRDSDNGLSPDG
jgi:hypothetical protein